MTSRTSADLLRQSLNLILAPGIWILSSIGFIVEGARTPADFSDSSENWLVPLGPAFSIWFPIFLLCLAYGVVQALPKNGARTVFRDIGWWTAAGFAFICGWSLITAFAPQNMVQWGSALVFVPAVACLIRATVIMTRHVNSVTAAERVATYWPISLIAGWCSLAVFLNWTPIAYDVFAGGQANLLSSLLILSAALGLVIWVCRTALCNKVYVLPAVWGLAWLAARHLLGTPEVPAVGWAAAVGILLLIASALARPKVPISGYDRVAGEA